jgi:hypothetical protein
MSSFAEMLPASAVFFERTIRAFEEMEGKLRSETINDYYKGVCDAYNEAYRNAHPMLEHKFRQRMEMALLNVRTRSLHAYFMEFVSADTQTLGMDIISMRKPDDIVVDAKTLRNHVVEMGLGLKQAHFFFILINRCAREQLKARGLTQAKIRKLLAVDPADFAINSAEPLIPQMTPSTRVNAFCP